MPDLQTRCLWADSGVARCACERVLMKKQHSDSAVQRLSVALQRSIQRDQILRSHLRRGKGGNDAAPDGHYDGCGDGG